MTERSDNSGSPIFEALYRGDAVAAEKMAAEQLELDAFEAAAIGRAERLRELLDGDPSLARAWSSDGFTALHLAAFFGRAGAAQVLLERGADPEAVSQHEFVKVTALHSAVAQEGAEDGETARALLDHGAPVNAPAEDGGTPLHSAAANGNRKLVELLLAHGAEPAAVRDDGKTPADLAREAGHDDVAEALA